MSYSHFYDGLSMYDWVYPEDNNLTPREAPYSFSPYYVWRKNLTDSNPVYTDRMWEWDREKAKEAFGKHGQRVKEFSESECNKIVKAYFGSKYKCVGFSMECNRSSGYEIGVFYLKEEK